ncbi:MAG: arsenate reductase [Sulfurimonas sp.]|jgi:arsenate reductase|uniref:arsenate reductase (glutaredoxin) n=1 Tax=Sulfurimonas sp. TaxID=2022749 RepID=UPI0039E3637F
MSNVKIWHNPRCTKSREAVKLVEELGISAEIVKYLDELPDEKEIKSTLKMLGLSARELMRTTEAIYKELDLKNENDEEKLIAAMVKNPKLIQRPVLFKDGKAIIGRPSSIISEWLL